MQHWRSVLPPGVMLDIRYEDIVTDLEGHARAIVDYCNLGVGGRLSCISREQAAGEDVKSAPGP